MRIERELMRGAGPTAVLKLVERRDMYGYELVEALDQKSAGALAMGQSTLYPLLYNLEAQGFVEAYEQAAPSGRLRRYYRLTDKGRRRLAESTKQWRALARAMQLLGVVPGSPAGQEVPA